MRILPQNKYNVIETDQQLSMAQGNKYISIKHRQSCSVKNDSNYRTTNCSKIDFIVILWLRWWMIQKLSINFLKIKFYSNVFVFRVSVGTKIFTCYICLALGWFCCFFIPINTITGYFFCFKTNLMLLYLSNQHTSKKKVSGEFQIKIHIRKN